MSISAMANIAIARREAPIPAGTGAAVKAAAVATQPPPTRTGASSDALDVLMAYIPTETLVLYVAVLAAVQDGSGVGSSAPWWSFRTFLVATPVVVWLVFAGKLRGMGEDLPLKIRAWPKWEMTAATVAFVAWAMALPDTPFMAFPWYSSALAGVTVLVASSVLGLLAPIFMRKKPATS